MVSERQALRRFLRQEGLATESESPEFVPLTGGVSSDIWHVALAGGDICVKRALPRLKVDAEWRAPISRNASEVAWIQEASRIVPGCVPKIHGHDAETGVFAMEYFDASEYRLWKDELRAGRVALTAAAAVGDTLGQIHAATADNDGLARRFANDRIFYEIRLEPYLVAAGSVHEGLARALAELVDVTSRTKRVLVHGDVSPKNILLGPAGPIFLDAECAWYGDPAFDLGFCLNHLLLKCLWTPSAVTSFIDAFDILSSAYFAHVKWESAVSLEARVAHLLPGLLLARIDGKSPVEYVRDEDEKAFVRNFAGRYLANPVASLDTIRSAWREGLSA